MTLQLPPSSFTGLHLLVIKYNSIPENDPVQKIFYLQKINTELNNTTLDDELFDWLYSPVEGWNAQLRAFEINPDASFFLKGIQFAQAVVQHTPTTEASSVVNRTEYQIMQERDALLHQEPFEQCQGKYVALCHELNNLAQKSEYMAAMIKRQTQILESSKAKFAAIREKQLTSPELPAVHYQTNVLGTPGNNFNFKFTMTGWEHPFVFRVEDRDELGLEQKLYSYPVSKYFVEDFSVFMWGFENKDQQIEYKPVFLSQFAKQGNLAEIAKSLRTTNPKYFASIITHYFNQLTDLCMGLIEADAYHPDIKLTNILVHDNRLVISDRKTLMEKGRCTADIPHPKIHFSELISIG